MTQLESQLVALIVWDSGGEETWLPFPPSKRVRKVILSGWRNGCVVRGG
jgi:hypothetical protein